MKRLVISALLASVVACSKQEEAPPEEETAQAVVAASVATVEQQHFIETVDAVGVVTARAGRIASLSAPGPTRVASVNTAGGVMVHAGDLLIELERGPFLAEAQSADAALAAARSAADRAQRLADAGIIPRKEAEQATAALAQAKAAAQIAQRALDLASVKSPIDGVITRILAMTGANVDVGQPLVEITDVSALDASFTLSVTDARRVSVGETVTMHGGSDATAAVVSTGRVVSIAAIVDTGSLGVTARVELPRGTTAVRLGETVFGRIAIRDHADALVVPLESLVPEDEGFKVFVVDSAGVAHATPVTIGGRSDAVAWIKEGVHAGDKVVAHGAFGVSDGAKVVSDTTKAPEPRDTTSKTTGKTP